MCYRKQSDVSNQLSAMVRIYWLNFPFMVEFINSSLSTGDSLSQILADG
ncbi:MAG TPA: hypothetical protein VK203_28280 [Nostocaceae cyanobacterium]|nr:hypothetical protein [Nostocaceae cyanobacterium]